MVFNQQMELRILLPEFKDAVIAYAKGRLAALEKDPMELEMKSWSARWRGEALDHYLKLGWSFGLFEGDKLRGFILGQPFLFHRGLTQTLWIEHLEADDDSISATLLDCASKWARDKHFQCVLLEDGPNSFKEIKTARFQ